MAVNSICSLNLDRKMSNMLEFKSIIDKYRPLICLLQDVPGGCREICEVCNTIANSYLILIDEQYLAQYKRINNLILVDKERINVIGIHKYSTHSKATSLGISISRINTETRDTFGRMIIFSVYIKPRSTHQETKHCLEWISNIAKANEGHSRTLIAGDFNATDPIWCPTSAIMENNEGSEAHYRQIKLTRGRSISVFMNKSKLTCLNRKEAGPTFNNGRYSSYIDLAMVGNITIRQWCTTKLENFREQSAHKVMIIETKSKPSTNFSRRTYKKIRLERLTSQHFLELHLRGDQLCRNWKQLPRNRIMIRMERLTNMLYNAYHAAQQNITSTSVKRNCASLRPDHLRELKAKTRQRIKKLGRNEIKLSKLTRGSNRQRSENRNNNERALKAKIRKLKQKIIDNLKANELHMKHDYLRDRDIWERIHCYDNLVYNRINESELNTNDPIKSQRDIDELAEAKFPTKSRITSNYVTSVRPTHARVYILDEEITAAMKVLRKKTYMSSNGIKMNVFYRSFEYVSNIIKALVEMSFWICYVPEKARQTQGSLIPKKSPGQFRIVHVSSPLAALLELIALKRLEFRLETKRLNSPHQFGFSTSISRHDLIARIIEFIYKGYFSTGPTASSLIISLDIEGAFDNVNQDKLIQLMEGELGNDPIKYWLAEFVLNRRISIKKGTLKSHSREICQGVPQGSALGPILWNYMIHELEVGINIPGKAELLKYADDLLLIYNGNNMHEVQTILYDLTDKLTSIDLSIRPEKCSVMGIRLGIPDRRKIELSVNNIIIKAVRKMNILGIPLTRKLKLDRTSIEHKEKLSQSISRLHKINNTGLINNAQEWRILIDSYLKSKLIVNNWPILLIDGDSCKWIDVVLLKALRVIYNWPQNISSKLINLVTKTLDCKTLTTRLARYRALGEFREIYEFLLKISTPAGMLSEKHNINHVPIVNLTTGIFRQRKQSDPVKSLRVLATSNNYASSEPIWLLLDRQMGSMMVELCETEILQIRIGRHNQYPISYFNSFALLLKIVSERTIQSRTLVMSETNSILKALENTNNNDWRVIQLRERMFDNYWKIQKITLSEEHRLKTRLIEQYQQLNLRLNPNDSEDYTAWLIRNENNLDDTHSNRPYTHQVEQLYYPDLSDYKRRNYLNKWIPIEDNTFFLRMNTNITKELTPKPSIWQNIPPNWLSGQKMLALTGMIINTDEQLENGEREPSHTCNLCEHLTDDNEQDITNNWLKINEVATKKYLILHRTFVCKALRHERSEFIRRVQTNISMTERSTDRDRIEHILINRQMCQRLLSFMVKCSKAQRNN